MSIGDAPLRTHAVCDHILHLGYKEVDDIELSPSEECTKEMLLEVGETLLVAGAG